jgi:uncharacterized membrane protein YeaQ/YmgE (transglycosylase-associated protein family)
MLNWVAAIVIGVVIGVIGALILGRQSTRARWLAFTLSVVGALVGGIFGAAFGHHGYGWKRAVLQIVLAIVGVVAAAMLDRRSSDSTSNTGTAVRS